MVIHNADFDVGFLDAELKIASSTYPSISEICEVKDTLAIARNKFPGSAISLDALCKRFRVDNSRRKKHTALIDCELLYQSIYKFIRSKRTNISV